ncbi:MAG: hypothetical protein ACYC33_11165 [Thermoleophilia bacterium]
MFRILYLFFLQEPPSWVAYVHAAVMFALMGLVYLQSSRRGVGFMVVFLAMAGIFMVDIFGYVPFLAYITLRDRRRKAAVVAAPAVEPRVAAGSTRSVGSAPAE